MKMQSNNIFEEFPKLKEIPEDRYPSHVLIIPDGNGRWAKRFQKLPSFGHAQGFKILQKVIKKFEDLPINTLTVWAFSSNNWKRDSEEVESLMKIFDAGLKEALKDLEEKKMRFVHLGRRDRLPDFLKETIQMCEEKTKNYGPKIFCVALDYSGEDQELRMMQKVHLLPKNTEITLDLIKTLRDGNGLVLPADLIIRTSGENRVSDLGWITENSEFYSMEKMLPEAGFEDFVDALLDYAKRERRFGGRVK